jgi:hypothetical protein
MLTVKENKGNTDLVTSDGADQKAILDAIVLIKDMAVGTVSVQPLEDCKSNIEMFRGTIAYMIDFNGLHSPHYDIREALLTSFDKAVAEEEASNTTKGV